MTETADERAERLLAVGLDVAVQIRDDDPEAVARLLQALDRTRCGTW
jgi:electron transfer flavoprotein alpha/beta subunit